MPATTLNEPPPVTDVLAARRKVHEQLRDVADRLIAEFSAVVPAGQVLRSVATAREELMRLGVRSDIVAATEAKARLRLAQLSPAHQTV